jgi:hypothetical protein
LKLKYKFIDVLEEGEDNPYPFDDLERITKESLEKYQRHIMALKKCSRNMKKVKQLKRSNMNKGIN